MPDKPNMVSGSAPNVLANRMISAMPRVNKAALALAPYPRPSQIPAAIASTFLTVPPTCTPNTSLVV